MNDGKLLDCFVLSSARPMLSRKIVLIASWFLCNSFLLFSFSSY
uniref:Uncharacterized protein n=1 Tax=Rhizophora mucronata TaxID=61149 RepID=A0A2P2P7M5_RHIMU